jgi:hypothetical protein
MIGPYPGATPNHHPIRSYRRLARVWCALRAESVCERVESALECKGGQT